tara:strand:+ start:236 stop:943 length:708 start_codon:yes stop_codon:yes gene_type:complete
MSNIYINPSSGIIEFNTGAASGDFIDINESGASRFTFENSGELNLSSLGTGVAEKFTIDSQSGRLFSVDTNFDSVFSANDIAGLPILEAYSDGSVVMGDYNSGDFVLTGNKLGVGTKTPASRLHVDGSVTSVTDLTTTTSSSYTFVSTDQSNMVSFNSANPITGLIPPNSSVAFPIGTEISVFQLGAGQLHITTGSNAVSLNAADDQTKTRVQFSSAVCYKTGTDGWLLVGDLTS